MLCYVFFHLVNSTNKQSIHIESFKDIASVMNCDDRWYPYYSWTPKNDDEYYHGATRNDPNPATVELRSRPRPQSNTIHPDKFKRFKLVVALSSMFLNHHDSSRITTVQLRFTRVHHDGSTALLRIIPMHPDLTNRVNRSSAVAQNRECVTGALWVISSSLYRTRKQIHYFTTDYLNNLNNGIYGKKGTKH